MTESKRYTVGELIKELEQFPRETPVLIRGYEEGHNDVKGVSSIVTFYENFYKEWYYGKHKGVNTVLYNVPDEKYNKFNGVIIS
jgi:hypothetical protein